MRFQRIGLSALVTFLATILSIDLKLPILDWQLIQNSQVLAQTPTDRKAEANRLFQQGIEQFDTSQFEAALQSWQKALIIYREIKDRYGEGASVGSLGLAYHALGDYTKAIEYQQQTLAIVRELKDRLLEGKALGNLGNAYKSLGDYTKAIEYHQQTLAIARQLKDRLLEGKALGNLGNAYKSLGDYTKAIDYHQQTLAITRELEDRNGEGKALGNLGNAYRSLGDYSKAIDYHQQSLAIARELNDRDGEGASLGNLGNAYRSLGDYSKAIDYHQQSLAIARELNDRDGEGASLGNLGVAYDSLGDYSKAIDYHQQSLVIAREINDRDGEGNALGNLGVAYESLGDYTKAIEYHQQTLVIARELKDRYSEGASLGNLGLAYKSLGDYTKAIDYLQQTLAIAREIKDRQGEGASLGNLGLAYKSLGDYTKAIDYLHQHLAIAQEIKDRQGEGDALSNLGIAYRSLGDYTKAIEYHQQSLAIAREIGDKDGEGIDLNNLGLALQKSGNLSEAERILRAGIEARESQRRILGDKDAYKVSIFERQASTYRLLQEVLIAQNKTNDALEVAERGRARAFVELLAKRLSPEGAQGITSPSTVDPPTIEEIQQIAKVQNSTLVQYSITYEDFKVQGKEQTKESNLYIWVIKPTGEVTFRSVDLTPLWQCKGVQPCIPTSLNDIVTDARESIGVRGRAIIGVVPTQEALQNAEAKATKRLQQLHQLLIEPIADLLPADPNAHVIFIPQQRLFLAPFPALQDASGKYLIEKHTILTAPSIQVLDLTHKQRQRVGAQGLAPLQGNDALVVGNPTMPSVRPAFDKPPQQLPPLPGAEREAKAIALLLNTQPLIGDKATKTVVEELLPKARIIHLATHGLLDDKRGLGSSIALAPDPFSSSLSKIKQEGGNGLLTAEEILSLKLNAELVVLSACDTGRGRIAGDGVVGLSRSLISAGVSSVIVSLWAVSDDSTAFLMTEFYKNLQKNSDKAQALRQSMLTTMKQTEYSNPRQWAAFTLIGEAE
jgi:CHAT domain-containing protein/tetratricopeptide (TPR) repeat protein